MLTAAAKRAVGLSDASQSIAFSKQNVDFIVKKLSRMRGAALKLGQMLSIQDNKMVPPEVNAIFRRVHDSANYMPEHQLEKVLVAELGNDWRTRFESFPMVPFAAASIGQVHKAVLATGETVAVKVQYPGVASSISSDLANLKSMLVFGNMLPKGMYLDNTIRVAEIELAWECDYKREAASSEAFAKHLEHLKTVFGVPRVFHEHSTSKILTTEFVRGVPIDQTTQSSQHIRNRIGESIFKLCLMEVFKFRFMQTDPNWGNFLYDASENKIQLIDFGASRDFPQSFTDDYMRLLYASATDDVDGCIKYSRTLGFLTGYESSTMTDAHVTSLKLLSKPFAMSSPHVYDFAAASEITDKVRQEISVMLRERLTPPPDVSYSLHRKLAGCFLLCTKLGAQIRCRDVFMDAYREYSFASS